MMPPAAQLLAIAAIALLAALGAYLATGGWDPAATERATVPLEAAPATK